MIIRIRMMILRNITNDKINISKEMVVLNCAHLFDYLNLLINLNHAIQPRQVIIAPD